MGRDESIGKGERNGKRRADSKEGMGVEEDKGGEETEGEWEGMGVEGRGTPAVKAGLSLKASAGVDNRHHMESV